MSEKQQCSYCGELCAHGFCGRCERVLTPPTERTSERAQEERLDLVKGMFDSIPSQFHPCAYFDEPLDCIRVIARDCSVTETRISPVLTVLEDNYPAPRAGRERFVGFTIKGARHFCQEHGINLNVPVRLSELLDRILEESSELSVRLAVEAIVAAALGAEPAEASRAPQPEDYEWAVERVTNMCASALADAHVYGKKLLKGFGYPNETFSRAQDHRALRIVLEALNAGQPLPERPASQPSPSLRWQPIATVPKDGKTTVLVRLWDGRFSTATYDRYSEPQAKEWLDLAALDEAGQEPSP